MSRNLQKLIQRVFQIPQDRRKALNTYLKPYLSESRKERFEEVLSQRTRHLVVAMEDTYQEHNAGAIIRSADCFGLQDVYVIQNHNAHKVANTIAKGSTKWVTRHLYDQDNNGTKQCMKDLKEKGYQIVGTTPHTDITLNDLDISKPTAFFMGAEKRGISKSVEDECDTLMKIPMVGFTESFNVSVAVALILYDATTRLKKSEVDWKLSPQDYEDLWLEWTLKTIIRPEGYVDYFLENH